MYRVKPGPPSASKQAECFFIRKRNWRDILRSSKANPNLKQIIEDFKTMLLLRYIDKLYLPIKVYKDLMVQNEKNKQDPNNKLRALMLLFGSRPVKKEDQGSTPKMSPNVGKLEGRKKVDRDELLKQMLEFDLTRD